MNKPTKPNITIPESFAANGVKADFDNNKILNGFDRIQPDVLAGDNLNKFIDDTYKGLNYGIKGVDYLEERWKSQLTNCILEIPQRIKLELADGTLTLKAGSEVIVPNGFEADGTTPKFDYVTVESDLTNNKAWLENGINFIVYFVDDNTVGCFASAINCNLWSGENPTIDKQYGIWYNTVSNTIQYTDDAGANWRGKISLPLAICSANASFVYTSIDQIFNGMGYIGSTVWVDKGVKGLIPNGRNEDGTLNNIEHTQSTLKVLTPSVPLTFEKIPVIITAENRLGYNSVYTYDEKNNIVYDGTIPTDQCVIGWLQLTNSVISNFRPKQPLRLATTDMVDGQWQKLSTHTTILSVNSYGTYEVDLSAFLPKDGYSYEITLWYRIDTQLKINDIYIWYQTSLMHDVNIYYEYGGGANDTTWYRSASTTTIPIGIDRKLIFKVNTTATPTNINFLILNLCGYRRLGMN